MTSLVIRSRLPALRPPANRIRGSSTLPSTSGQFAWPDGQKVAVCLTFDVDAEAGYIGEGDAYRRRLSTLSEGRFGVRRGLPRILELLERRGLPATFFVPGLTAEMHPDAVASILAASHEVGHHGHFHVRSDMVDADTQRKEIELGFEALTAVGAPRPRGYRSTSWELTPETFELLVEHGFDYDSSCMGDDRPYLEIWEGKSILELPVHWSLDDWPHFAWSIDGGGNLSSSADLLARWRGEYRAARAEGRALILTMHPEVIGRAHRLEPVLGALIEEILADGDAWFATMQDLADAALPAVGAASQ
jgi:peptidoglycan/xylan/chitin deacetylase (PgdA/CDA1 family)